MTELLGIAPVGMLHGLSKDFVESFLDELLAPSLKAQAVDFKFHWVSEAGEAAHSRLSGGMSILPMVHTREMSRGHDGHVLTA